MRVYEKNIWSVPITLHVRMTCVYGGFMYVCVPIIYFAWRTLAMKN